VWVDEIVDDWFQIEEFFGVVKIAKVAHGFDAVFDVLVVSFDVVVVVFESVLFELD